MRRKLFLMSGLAALAVACGDGGGDRYASAPPPAPAPEMMEADAITVSAARSSYSKSSPRAESAMGQSGGEDEPPVDDRQLAYEYNAQLRLPSEAVGTVMKAHEERCRAAGPRVCQVISSSINEQGEDYVYANLEFRAAKDYMTPFREGLASEAEDAKGQLSSMNARAEDLTRTITDTSARLDAQRDLRERLLRLLERDTDEVGDLLQIELELVRVQGEIESAESYLKFLQGRVSMDRMTLNYQSIPKAVTPSTIDPLKRALTNFFGDLTGSLAAVISFIAAALPWVLIGLPVMWLAWRLVKGMFRRRKG